MASGAYIIVASVTGLVPGFAATLAAFTVYSLAYRRIAHGARYKNATRDLAADGEYLLWGIVTYLGHI